MLLVQNKAELATFNALKEKLTPIITQLELTSCEGLRTGSVVKQLRDVHYENPIAVIISVLACANRMVVRHRHLSNSGSNTIYVDFTENSPDKVFEYIGNIEDMEAVLPNSVPR